MAEILTRNVKNHFNAKTNTVTVYDVDNGAPLVVSRLNARDLVYTGKYTFAKSTPAERSGKPAIVDVTTGDEEVAGPSPTEEFDPKDVMRSLESMAKTHGTATSAEDFLKGYSLASLRMLAEERYGHKLHPATKTPGAIKKILELEEDRLNALPDWFEEPEDDSVVVVATPLPANQPTPGELEEDVAADAAPEAPADED
jgi:hypothetical protein